MQCQDIHNKLRAGETLRGPAAQLHLSDCEACQLLADEHAFLAAQLVLLDEEATPAAEDALFAALQAEISAETPSRSRLRALPTWSQYTILALFSALMFGIFSALKLRPDFSVYPGTRMIASLALFGLFFVVGIWATQRPLHKPALGQSALWSIWGFSLLLPVLFALWPEAHHHAMAKKTFAHQTIACFGFGVVNASGLLFLAKLLSHGERPRSGTITLALAGGLYANIILQLHCPMVHPLHLALSHATVGVTLLLGFFGFSAWQDRRATS